MPIELKECIVPGCDHQFPEHYSSDICSDHHRHWSNPPAVRPGTSGHVIVDDPSGLWPEVVNVLGILDEECPMQGFDGSPAMAYPGYVLIECMNPDREIRAIHPNRFEQDFSGPILHGLIGH